MRIRLSQLQRLIREAVEEALLAPSENDIRKSYLEVGDTVGTDQVPIGWLADDLGMEVEDLKARLSLPDMKRVVKYTSRGEIMIY